jgi:hypothetical protein
MDGDDQAADAAIALASNPESVRYDTLASTTVLSALILSSFRTLA